MKDKTTILVVDWRAPIANVYYENGLGMCSYLTPDGEVISMDLQKKRTYEIEEDRLLEFYDSEVVANDELLTKYLAIRNSPYRNLVVQGVARSQVEYTKGLEFDAVSFPNFAKKTIPVPLYLYRRKCRPCRRYT